MAVESGSRAWGFASTDSDYDVRFIYVRSQRDYLRLDPPRDVIELPINDDLDVVGWDLPKTLKLLFKSNPSCFEWLASPIVYAEDADFCRTFRPLAQRYFSVERVLELISRLPNETNPGWAPLDEAFFAEISKSA